MKILLRIIFIFSIFCFSAQCMITSAQSRMDLLIAADKLYKQGKSETKKYRKIKWIELNYSYQEEKRIRDSITKPIIETTTKLDSIVHQLYRLGDYQNAYKLSEWVTEITFDEFSAGPLTKGGKYLLFQSDILSSMKKYPEALVKLQDAQNSLFYYGDKDDDFKANRDFKTILQKKNKIYNKCNRLFSAWCVQDTIDSLTNMYVYTPKLLKDSLGRNVTTWDNYCINMFKSIKREDYGKELYMDVLFTRAYLASLKGERDEGYKRHPVDSHLGAKSINWIYCDLFPFLLFQTMDKIQDGEYYQAEELYKSELSYIEESLYREHIKSVMIIPGLVSLEIRLHRYEQAQKYIEEFENILKVINTLKYKYDIAEGKLWADVRRTQIAYLEGKPLDIQHLKSLINLTQTKKYGFGHDASILASIYIESCLKEEKIGECIKFIESHNKKDRNPFSFNYNMSLLYNKAGDRDKAFNYSAKCLVNALQTDSLSMAIQTTAVAKLFCGKNSSWQFLSEFMNTQGLDMIKNNFYHFFYKVSKTDQERIWNSLNVWPEIASNLAFNKDTTTVMPGQKKIYNNIYCSNITKTLYNSILLTKGFLFGLDNRIQEMQNQRNDTIYNSSKAFINWNDVKASMKKDDISIEFYPFRNYDTNDTVWASVYILPQDTMPHFQVLCSNKKLLEYYNVGNKSKYLYTLVWEKLMPSLRNVNNIYFSAVGLLGNIALEYAESPDGYRISDKYNIYRLTTTEQLTKPKKSIKISNITLFGNMKYYPSTRSEQQATSDIFSSKYDMAELFRGDGNEDVRGGSIHFNDLSETKLEIDSIAHIAREKGIKAVPIDGEDATEQTFNNLNEANVNILHLSTHGLYIAPKMKTSQKYKFVYDDNEETIPMEQEAMQRSILVMTGGGNTALGIKTNGKEDNILTAQEIAQMHFPNLKLVVLSACDTGLGDSSFEGVFGLQRAFKKAGAETILMSLCPVPTIKTRNLMIRFYKNLFDGFTPAYSLREAQQHFGYGYDFVLLDANK